MTLDDFEPIVLEVNEVIGGLVEFPPASGMTYERLEQAHDALADNFCWVQERVIEVRIALGVVIQDFLQIADWPSEVARVTVAAFEVGIMMPCTSLSLGQSLIPFAVDMTPYT